ncbi:MAG: V-type ATP synthase subunit D [Deltaproteobacteria bacterium]|jgi:V/A-type H+/Na+-transporting ATPase subunit D|nr:V-type ATP synthase subunit D [Deltaproteobacteria bacterium]
MAKLVLSKSGLHKQRENMRLYERVLPSLELKRMQLTSELKRAGRQLDNAKADEETLKQRVARQLPMLGDREMDLTGLVDVESIHIDEENMVGIRLPTLVDVRFRVSPYSMLARPHWTDVLTDRIKEMVSQKVRVQVMTQRVGLLEQSARKITQRTNLFEKILIPQARRNIRKIQVYLADADRAAVIRSKITKRIRKKQAEAFSGASS